MSQFRPTADVTRITDWITEQGLLGASLEALQQGFCERMVSIGFPLLRGYASVRTLHPTISGLAAAWHAKNGLSTDVYVHRAGKSQDFMQSPIKRLFDQEVDELRVRLHPDQPSEFPLCEDLRQQGATDYILMLRGFGRDGVIDSKTGLMSSWTTTKPGGFTEDDLALLRHVKPYLAIAVRARLAQDISVNLLDTYVGSEAGRRILDGEIRRGALDVISAVIFLADLRGFTAMSERTPRDELVEMLNQYFDCLVAPIVEQGGNVLKFLGDGLLATFPLNGYPAEELCAHALDAAVEVQSRIADVQAERLAKGKPVMDLDIALHLGDVYWGNVGSVERLDFTVVGPAVNEAARIEALCGQYERNLLMSEAFAKAAKNSSNRLISIGRFGLRGVQSSQAIYTLDEATL